MLLVKPVIQASLLITIMLSQAAHAQWPNPFNSGYNPYYYNNYASQYNRPANYSGYNSGYNNQGYYAQPNYQYSNNQNSGYQAPNYQQAPNQGYYQAPNYRAPGYQNYNRPPYPYYHKKNSGMPFTGNSDFMEELWPGRDNIYADVLPMHGPWDRGWGRAPWNRDYDNLWGRKGGPSKWFDFEDPEEGIAEAWEDMMITPNRLGTMPGGWEAPSISIPNPVDVQSEFRDAAIDMPGEMQDFSEGFTYGGDDGYDNPDRGSIGFGKKKKNDGVSISPKIRR